MVLLCRGQDVFEGQSFVDDHGDDGGQVDHVYFVLVAIGFMLVDADCHEPRLLQVARSEVGAFAHLVEHFQRRP